MTSKAQPHHQITSSVLHSVETTCSSFVHLRRHDGWTTNVKFGQQTKAQILCGCPDIQSLCLSVKASLFTCSSSVVAYLQQFKHEGLIHRVSSEPLMLRCFCYLKSVKHACGSYLSCCWFVVSDAGDSNEPILCSRGNSWSLAGLSFLFSDEVFASISIQEVAIRRR